MAVLASDNFDRANLANLGANWTDDGRTNHFTIASNTAVPSGFASDAGCHYSAITWPNNHYSKAKITVTGTAGGDQGIGVEVRWISAGNFYTAVMDHAASSNIGMFKNVGGSYTHLATTTQAFTNGDTFELDAVGTALTVLYQGTLLGAMSTTDASNTTGSAGLYSSSSYTSGSLNDWVGGDAPSATVPPVGRARAVLQAIQRAANW